MRSWGPGVQRSWGFEVLIVLWFVAAMPAAQTTGATTTGILSGVATDMATGVMPAVSIKVTNGKVTRNEVTNREGRFTFTGLPGGWYREEATLAGFKTVVQDPIGVRTGAETTIALHMQIGDLAIVDYIASGPAEAVARSTLIAHIKLLSYSGPPVAHPASSSNWVAEVLEAVKDPADVVRERRLRFWQPDQFAFTVGQEVVAFLVRRSNGELYALPHNMVQVSSGVAQWRGEPRDGIAPDMPIAAFLTGIRRLADQAIAGPGKEKELTLKPGLSLPWTGTHLGHSREFDNDIYGLKCSPVVTVGGRVLQWIDRLHVTSGRVFVESCEELELNLPDSKWPRPAAFADWIFEATMGGDETYPQIQLRRLALPGWGYQSNGVFCGRFVAYWSLERDPGTQAVALHARIADLFTQAVVVMERLGPVDLETDNPGALETPVWDDHCRVATMSGKRYGLPVTRLTVPG